MDYQEIFVSAGRVKNKPNKGSYEISYQGIPLVIENDEGSVRKWKNESGEKGKVLLFYRYGYIKDTRGIDGEEIDCFVGHNPYSSKVFIIKLGKDDREEKVMFGFDTIESARDAFLAHYNDQEYLGEIVEMPMYLFKSTLEFV